MNFSSKGVVYYLINQFNYYLLIIYIKKPVVLKCQQFEKNENNKTKSNKLKYQQLDMHNNKEGQSLNKYKDKGENKRYIYIYFFIALFSSL